MTELAQDPERVRTGWIWRVGGALIAITAALTIVAWWLVVPPAETQAMSRSPLEHGLIDQATGGADAVAAGTQRLERYEWIDRAAGVVHIPIERAIDAVVSDPALIGARTSVGAHAGGDPGFGDGQ